MSANGGVSLEKAGASKGVIALRVATVVLVAIAAYLGVLWLQLGAVVRSGERIESRLAASVVGLNSQVDAFRGDPDSAQALLPGLAAARADISQIRQDAGSVAGGALPPFSGAGNAYASALAAYATDVDAYYGQLAGIARFVVDRSAVIQKTSQGLAVLKQLSAAGTTEKDVERIIGQAQDAVGASADQLRSLMSTATSVYSSDALLARLTALSRVLGDIETGLADKDAAGLRVATQAFSKLMQADWQTLFFLADETGVQRLTSSIAELGSDRTHIASVRADLSSTRTALGSLAIGLIVIALVTAGVAWLR